MIFLVKDLRDVRKKLVFILIGVLGSAAYADTTSWTEVGFSTGVLKSANSEVNPANRILEIPSISSLVDIRNETSFEQKRSKYVIKPRWTASIKSYTYDDSPEQVTTAIGKLDITAAYGSFRPFKD